MDVDGAVYAVTGPGRSSPTPLKCPNVRCSRSTTGAGSGGRRIDSMLAFASCQLE